MKAGALRQRGTLENPPTVPGDADGAYEPLTPPVVWLGIEPQAPGGGDNRQLLHLVTMRSHSQVTIDTRITVGSRRLYVRGLQDAGGGELRLLCEEII